MSLSLLPANDAPLPDEEKVGWEMKELKPKHKQICSMLAQGIPRSTIAAVIGCTPEYITMLSGQSKMKDYIAEMCQAAGLQLDAMFVQAVEAVGDVLSNGSPKERIQAARLQMEASKRIGPRTEAPQSLIDSNERLTRLAERLLYLQSGTTATLNSRRDEDGKYVAITAD